MMNDSFSDISKIVSEILKSYPQIRRAWVFGSFVSDTFSDASDLDLMVDFDRPMGLKFIMLAEDLEAAIGRRVDLLTLDQADQLENKFGYEIVGKAAPVYERIA